MKRGNIILLSAVLAMGLAIAAAVSVLHGGLSARATPTALEVFLVRKVRHLAIPSGARTMTNPVADSPEVQQEAMRHFADHCAFCHANDGSGDSPIGSGLYPKPPDLRAARTQKLSDGELFWIIQNGVRFTGMPAFGGASGHGDAEDTWKLVRFIRHLPQLTMQERIEMEQYNPKGPEDREEEKDEQDFLNGAPPQPSTETPRHHH